MIVIHYEIIVFIDFIIYFLLLFCLFCFFFQKTRDKRTCLEDFHLLYCLPFFYENRLLWKTLNYIMKTCRQKMAFVYTDIMRLHANAVKWW